MSEKRGSLLTAATFFLPFFLLLGIFAALGLAPFGDRSLLVSDAQGQYLSYFALYQDLFAGKADWFYSFGKLLGGSLSGLFAYYLASPFNLILLLFPKEQIPLAVDWMILLKMSACGLTMGLYLRRCFGLRPESLVLTTAYALCGYNNAYAWCVMWLDAAVLLPGGEPEQRSFVSVKCPNCGAPNSLPAHSRGRCEYCGSSLAAE